MRITITVIDDEGREFGGEATLSSSVRRTRQGPKERKPARQRRDEEKGLPGHLLKLKGSGFFGQPRTANEVQQKLQPTYACDVNRTAMALLRLQRRRELRKTSKSSGGKRQVAYVS